MSDAPKDNGLAEQDVDRRARLGGTPVALVLLAALLETYLVLNVWITCDIGGINSGVSFMTVVLFVAPGLLLVHAALLAVAAWIGRRADIVSRRVLVALLLGMVVAVAFVVATQVATPAEPSLTCPTGVPAWWPSWLPHGSYGAR